MSSKYDCVEEYELSCENSHESDELLSGDDNHAESQLLSHSPSSGTSSPQSSLISPFFSFWHQFVWRRRWRRPKGAHRTARGLQISGKRAYYRPSFLRKIVRISNYFLVILLATIVAAAIFYPSYTRPPLHYKELRRQIKSSSIPGRGNIGQEKVFIAASIYDDNGDLAGGTWGRNILDLLDLLGPKNVYLSIYENDAGPTAQRALQELEKSVTCPHSLVFEEHLPLNDLPQVKIPDGSMRVKRITYLAEVRNRALKPLQSSEVRYDKLLYLNDVVFNPIDAVHLLFSTNAQNSGRADYRAACAVDFINPFKFYDNFATRDSEGYSMGIPFFPWFTASGDAQSLQHVLDGKDAVHVRSCWGGMVAFDANFFQKPLSMTQEPITAGRISLNLSSPYQFRAEKDLYWDASECCLIHADIQNPDPTDSGIYMNPYVRVAYGTKTLFWLGFTRRFEHLYSPIHFLLNTMAGMPWYNPRRAEQPLERVDETVWVPDESLPSGGSFQVLSRIASNSGFCGRRALQVIREDRAPGEKNWEFLPIPS